MYKTDPATNLAIVLIEAERYGLKADDLVQLRIKELKSLINQVCDLEEQLDRSIKLRAHYSNGEFIYGAPCYCPWPDAHNLKPETVANSEVKQ